MKHRLLRVRELLKRELSEAIQKELTFENAIVTVNEVDVTPDLRQGHVFVGIVGPEKDQKKAFDKLCDNQRLLQKLVNKRVVLKFTPKLHFRLDNSVARGVNVLSIIEDLPEIEEHEGADGEGEIGEEAF